MHLIDLAEGNPELAESCGVSARIIDKILKQIWSSPVVDDYEQKVLDQMWNTNNHKHRARIT